MSGIVIESSLYWFEGPIVNNVVVRNNYFENTNLSTEGVSIGSAINISVEMWGGGSTALTLKDLFVNIDIKDNEFRNIRAGLISGRNISGLNIENNKVENAFYEPKSEFYNRIRPHGENYMIYLQNCEKVTVKNNTVSGLGSVYKGLENYQSTDFND